MIKSPQINCHHLSLAQMDYGKHILDGSKLYADHHVEVDVVIVGTGAGGAACAYQLTKNTDLRVLALEAGPYVPLKQLNHNLLDMMEALAWDRSQAGSHDGSFRTVHGRCVGGSTMLHMLTMTPLSERLFDHWREDLGIEPMSVRNFAPYVSELKRLMNIKPISREMVNANAEPWIKGCDELGYFWKLNERNAGSCIQSGRCHTGCPYGGKVSMDVSLIPHALNQGLLLYTSTMATKILTNRGTAFGVEAQHLNSEGAPLGRMTIKANHVIVAGGALQTPALLLRSGLQSPHNTVGSKLCAQPGINILGMLETPIYGWRGITNPIHIDEWNERSPGGFFIEPGMLDASINADFIPGSGKSHAERMAKYSFMTAGQILYADDGKENRVVWQDDKVNVKFNLSAKDHEHMRFAILKSAEILLAGGVSEVYVGQRAPIIIKKSHDLKKINEIQFKRHDFHFESVHVHGSCPMSASPEDGVTDPYGECHHVKNLYIADASLMPSAICMNTTIPSASMGMWVADTVTDKFA